MGFEALTKKLPVRTSYMFRHQLHLTEWLHRHNRDLYLLQLRYRHMMEEKYKELLTYKLGLQKKQLLSYKLHRLVLIPVTYN